jgi:excisionase family DNA binding protein
MQIVALGMLVRMQALPSDIQKPIAVTERLGGVLTVFEVAVLLRCSKAHVHNLINGKLPGVSPLPSLTIGRRRLVRQTTLTSWINQNEHGSTGSH